MAEGKTHALVSLGLAVGTLWLGPAMPPTVLMWEPAVFGALGEVSGIPISPDLDMTQKTISENVFGKLSWPWFVIWLPYARMIKHRSWLSHMPFVGTAGRLAYLLVPAFLLFSLAGNGHAVIGLIRSNPFRFFVVGLAISDTLHWFMDL